VQRLVPGLALGLRQPPQAPARAVREQALASAPELQRPARERESGPEVAARPAPGEALLQRPTR